MSKIFRLYKEGTDTYQDWNESPAFPYNSTALDTIEDPDGASARNEITSIPSPFARIDLVKRAFKEVCKMGLDGKTIFHKMVSDTLDVGEIFFNIDKYRNKIEIIPWNKNLMLTDLKASVNSGHQYLADALEKYMLSDSNTYNFDELEDIYLLNYVNGPDVLNIIGATSPATLFFSTANDLSYINDIYFGQDKPFDNDYQPLYKRDFEFVKMWFLLRNTIRNFTTLFLEVDNYLALSYRAINDIQKKNVLQNLSFTNITDFSEIEVKQVRQADIVKVLGHSLYQKSNKGAVINSDFVIATEKDIADKPLVLPVVSGGKYSRLQYTIAQWGTTNKAPYYDEETNLNKRVLPNDASIRAYLTISDFLEDTIIRVPHTLNKKNYFDGNIAIDTTKLSYLLPIKPLFFKYFDTVDLQKTLSDGKPMFEMETVGSGSVRVTLRIPIKGNGQINYIEYYRTYYKDRSANVIQNEGGVVEFDFTGFIMPLVKFKDASKAHYTVSCVSSYSRKFNFSLYNGTDKIEDASCGCRNDNAPNIYKAENYTIENQNFDYIRINDRNNKCGILLPIFKEERGIERFQFAIDLGTSNTHIEYCKEGEIPTAFAFTKEDTQVCEFFIPSYNVEKKFQEDLEVEKQLIEKDFLPTEIGSGDFKFPTRTVLSCAKFIDWTNEIKPFELINIPMTYDKRAELSYNNVKYNIKWGRGDEQRIIESYVECLMLMIRNKVLLNNGNLNATKITWFYPLSMPPRRFRILQNTWNRCYRKYFGEAATLSMTESAAPIQYFFKRYATSTNLVNVDIGGGTTDIAFAKDKKIQFVTSFRFASNALFENLYSNLDENNGIVDWYKKDILKLLQDKGMHELERVFNSPTNKKPANMASFLFSLKDNSVVRKSGINIQSVDFNYILQQDEEYKIVFILFYVSIIYHIAKILKAKELKAPRHITFSGNGSKIFNVISPDSRHLAKFTKVIFEALLGKDAVDELEILGLDIESNPKEATCKGGISGYVEDDDRDKIIAFKGFDNLFMSEEDTYAGITDQYKEKTLDIVKEFFDFTLDDLNRLFDYDNNFGINHASLELAKEVCYKDLKTFLDKGIMLCREETDSQDKIEETLFFYPIIGTLNVLSQEIYKSLQNN